MVLIASEIAGSGDGPAEGEVAVEEEEEEARQRYAAVEKRKRCIGLPGA